MKIIPISALELASLPEKFYCAYCKKECSPKIDKAEVSFEYGSEKGTQVDIRAVSDCCEDHVTDETGRLVNENKLIRYLAEKYSTIGDENE